MDWGSFGVEVSARYPRNAMTFDDYQRAARSTVNPALTSDERLLDAAAGLAEEAGEVLATIRKHRFRDDPSTSPRCERNSETCCGASPPQRRPPA